MIATPLLVEAHSLKLTFAGPVEALEAVELSIPAGQFVAIVGPSGCGKSTLLRLIAGLISPTAGELRVLDLPPSAARQGPVSISFVFQDPTLLPWRTASENVALPLELKRIRAQQAARVEQSLALVGLDAFGGSYPNQLSGGMRMRVSLARALVTRPDLLLLDEPFAALDDITRQELNQQLLEIWQAQRPTAIFVTHNIHEAVYLSERVLVMSRRPGRIVADIPVSFPQPRTVELRTTPEFARLAGEVAAALRDASS